MRISLGQIIVLGLIFFLLFGDFHYTKKKLTALLKQINNFFQKKNRKKGI